MASTKDTPEKIGAGHLKAVGAQGLDELRNALYADSNVAQRHVEYGIYGTRLPSEVADDRRIIDRDFDEEPDDRYERYEYAHDDREMER